MQKAQTLKTYVLNIYTTHVPTHTWGTSVTHEIPNTFTYCEYEEQDTSIMATYSTTTME